MPSCWSEEWISKNDGKVEGTAAYCRRNSWKDARLVKEQSLSIYIASAFVIDEADLMLELGFIQDVDQLLVRAKQDIQLLAFSATIPQQLEHFLP